MDLNTITITTQFEGLHLWVDAPEKVAFLRNLHRHIFFVDVTVEVSHSNRAIEFFILKNEVDIFILNKYKNYHPEMIYLKNLGGMSCEMIAADIVEFIKNKYIFLNNIKVTVSEDKENSGTIISN